MSKAIPKAIRTGALGRSGTRVSRAFDVSVSKVKKGVQHLEKFRPFQTEFQYAKAQAKYLSETHLRLLKDLKEFIPEATTKSHEAVMAGIGDAQDWTRTLRKVGKKIGLKSRGEFASFALNCQFSTRDAVRELGDLIVKNRAFREYITRAPIGLKKFHVSKRNKLIPHVAYHYTSVENKQFLKEIVDTRAIPLSNDREFLFLTLDRIEYSGNPVRQLELNEVTNNAKVRVMFQTKSQVDDFELLGANEKTSARLEPRTSGGGTQLIKRADILDVVEVKNIETGEVLFRKVDRPVE